MLIRAAELSDLNQILSIYSPYINDSAITFETVVPDLKEFTARFNTVSEAFPWLVCEENGVILGYAYAARHRDRIAYQWSVESSVYLSADAQGRGIGLHLYQALIAILKIQGIVNIYAVITMPNARSAGLHKRLGFEEFAVFKKIGYKQNAWHDVLWMLLVINKHEIHQQAPVLFNSLKSDERIKLIVKLANQPFDK